MNTNLGLIISDNNNSAFKSKSAKESHIILGKSILEWSASVLSEITGTVERISFQEINKCKQLLSQSEQVIINWADQPLIQKSTMNNLFLKYRQESYDAAAIFATSGPASVYTFKSEVLLKKLDELNIQTLSRDTLKQIFHSVQKNSKQTLEDKCQYVVVEDRIALAEATQELRQRILRQIMLSGVTVLDPATTYIDADVVIGEDTTILSGTILQGETVIGEGCLIGPNSRISGCKIGNNVEVANSVATDSSIGDETHVGPFAYLRPGSIIGSKVKIGDFVEVKKAKIGDRTKISHLTYVGDAEVGENVNIGCGVVFVNYDGKHKNKTIVGDNSFIGCNVNLVSPVVVKNDAYIAAGSTITEEVPENSLAIARARQVIKEDWVIKKDLKRK